MAGTGSLRRVVVTGLGAVSPLGIGVPAMWEAMLAGRSGVGVITLMDHEKFPVHIAGEVPDWDSTPWISPKEAKRLDRFSQFAIAASDEAVADAGLDPDALDLDRCGIVIGSGIGGIESMETQHARYISRGPRGISPLVIPLLMINAAPGQVAMRLGYRGVNYGPVSACASASHSLGIALRHVQVGDADVVIAGGSEAGITALGLGGFSNMGALSKYDGDPAGASRPFDRERDGFVIGEGCGVVILEELEHAKARGARIYAEFPGYGMTDDAHHITAPKEDGQGPATGIRLAMDNSGLNPEDVDYVNAHGTSTPYNDKIETTAIKVALGEHARKVAISSTKSMIGHLLGASGGIEFIVACLAITHGVIPPTINYANPDPECDLEYTPGQARELQVDAALSNSLGFGGHNCTLALHRFDG